MAECGWENGVDLSDHQQRTETGDGAPIIFSSGTTTTDELKKERIGLRPHGALGQGYQ